MNVINLRYSRNVLAITYRAIQAPMAGGIVNPDFVASVCNKGLLGFIPGGYLTIKSLEEFIITTKSLLNSDAKFGVNIFIDDKQRKEEQFLRKTSEVIQIEHLLKIHNNTFSVPPSVRELDYIDLIIKNSVPIASCTFGFFSKESVERLKANNIKIIGNATTIEEFKFCLKHGADAVVVQGMEAGGHQASFLSNKKNNNKTIVILEEARKLNPQAVIIAAGGISTNNMQNYFHKGADYVQLGTAFMMTYESSFPKECKEYIASKKQDIELTKNITGKWANGVKNSLTTALQSGDDYYMFPIQHYHTASLRAEAKKNLNPEYMSLWAGSNPENLEMMSLDSLIDKIKSTAKW